MLELQNASSPRLRRGFNGVQSLRPIQTPGRAGGCRTEFPTPQLVRTDAQRHSDGQGDQTGNSADRNTLPTGGSQQPSKNGAPAAANDTKRSRVLVTLKSAKKWPSTIKLPRENVMMPAASGTPGLGRFGGRVSRLSIAARRLRKWAAAETIAVPRVPTLEHRKLGRRPIRRRS